MPKPLLSADAIFDEALRLLAEEGAAGLTVRNLAARLRCSNKTLYQQVGAHEVLVRGVVARAFAQLELAFSADAAWEVAVESWCMALRAELLDHPDLCKLMTTADRDVVVDYVGQLMAVLERNGFTHSQASRRNPCPRHVEHDAVRCRSAGPVGRPARVRRHRSMAHRGNGLDAIGAWPYTLTESADLVERWLQINPERFCLLHGDYRLDNLLFDPDKTSVTVVDWQTITVGLPARDLAYFLGTRLETSLREKMEPELVKVYHVVRH